MRLAPSPRMAFALHTAAVLITGLPITGLLAPQARAQPQSEAPHRASIDADGIQRIRIVGGSYFFRPDRIVVRANVPVEFTLVKERGIAPHTFVIHAPVAGIEIDTDITEEPTSVRFTPTAPGRYEFYCRNRLLWLQSHREHGMEGVLEVVE